MTATDLLSLHWPVDAERLRARVPASLSLSTRDDTAWLSLVAFDARNLRPRGVPTQFSRSMLELRLQTYVRHRGTPGRYFFSIDASDRVVADAFRLTSRLPYFAADARIERSEPTLRFVSYRKHGGAPPATFDATITSEAEKTVGSREADADSMSNPSEEANRLDWFVGHSRAFGAVSGSLWALDIDRERPTFSRASARIHQNTLFDAAGLPTPVADPLAYFVSSWPMHASLPWRCR